jgi:hypothetical protein
MQLIKPRGIAGHSFLKMAFEPGNQRGAEAEADSKGNGAGDEHRLQNRESFRDSELEVLRDCGAERIGVHQAYVTIRRSYCLHSWDQ